MNKFKVRLNDKAKEHDIDVATGLYVSAAAAVPAILGIQADEYPVKITIWCDGLIPEYGPYHYLIDAPGDAACALITRWDGQTLVLRPSR
jgi:hypothetical protein